MDSLTLTTHDQKLELWISRIRSCRASGQTVSDWCSDNSVPIKSYYYWMCKIKREAFDALPSERKSKVHSPVQNTPLFAELPQHHATVPGNTAVVIRFGGLAMEIQNGADGMTIEHTLRIIKSLC